jgi:cytidylate kinase
MPGKIEDSPSLNDRFVVTLDGLAGSGKSSLAEALAKELQFINFNSGLLYRTVGFLALEHGVSPDDEVGLGALLGKHSIALVERAAPDGMRSLGVILDGAPVNAEIRTPEVSEATSRSSRFAAVRTPLLSLQREACPGESLVAEGRDMGTIVFPHAQVKFFVEASVAVRVERRIRQLGKNLSGLDADAFQKQIEREITERDARDAGRSVAPTIAAEGSLRVDNSSAPFEDTVMRMAEVVRAKLATR